MLAAYTQEPGCGHACQLAGSGARSICSHNKPCFYGLPAVKPHFCQCIALYTCKQEELLLRLSHRQAKAILWTTTCHSFACFRPAQLTQPSEECRQRSKPHLPVCLAHRLVMSGTATTPARCIGATCCYALSWCFSACWQDGSGTVYTD